MSWTVLAAVVYGGMTALVLVNIAYLRRRRRPGPASDGPLVSIVIPARNEASNLRRLLPTIVRQRYARFEVIVYDDASDDETCAVAGTTGDDRVRVIRGTGPPVGWIGKVHALYSATRHARGDVLLFLDADAELRHRDALGQLIASHLILPPPRVLTGLPRLSGGGGLLVSMIPFSLLVLFPIPLAPVGRHQASGVLNGQCWLIDRQTYLTYEPHRAHPREILEDVRIGRYLKRHGAAPHLYDLQRHVAVWMYGSFAEAWRGLRKNTYLIAGGRAVPVIAFAAVYVLTFVVLPAVSPVALVGMFLVKGLSDRHSGFPWWITLLTPVAVLSSLLLLIDSTITHWAGRVEWKGRRV